MLKPLGGNRLNFLIKEKIIMRMREPWEIEALMAEVASTITAVQAYRNKTFRMQLNPMAYTFEALAFIEEGLGKAVAHIRSLGTRTEPSYLFTEESERGMFDQLVSIQNFIRKRDIWDFINEYHTYKESLPTTDLEDIYGLLHLTRGTLEMLSEIVDE